MVLNITVPAGMVDINVHPRKSEVKFSDDKIIFKAVYHGILNALNIHFMSDMNGSHLPIWA